jgi:hypothetical protein
MYLLQRKSRLHYERQVVILRNDLKKVCAYSFVLIWFDNDFGQFTYRVTRFDYSVARI